MGVFALNPSSVFAIHRNCSYGPMGVEDTGLHIHLKRSADMQEVDG